MMGSRSSELKWYEAILWLACMYAASAVAAHFMGGWARFGARFACTAIPVAASIAACVIIIRYGFYVSTKNKVIVMEDGDVQAILDHIASEVTSEDAKIPFKWKTLDESRLFNMIRGLANQGAIDKKGETWRLAPTIFLQVVPEGNALLMWKCSARRRVTIDRWLEEE